MFIEFADMFIEPSDMLLERLHLRERRLELARKSCDMVLSVACCVGPADDFGLDVSAEACQPQSLNGV